MFDVMTIASAPLFTGLWQLVHVWLFDAGDPLRLMGAPEG
jgi:hypothetical protein